MSAIVTLSQNGREGVVTYRDGLRHITGYQEFGGDGIVALVSMGREDEWRLRHAWAVDQRAQILRHVADELVRQRAQACSAEIDEAGGNIVLRIKAGAQAPAAAARPEGAWVLRYGELKGKLGLIVLALALVLGAAMWAVTRTMN